MCCRGAAADVAVQGRRPARAGALLAAVRVTGRKPVLQSGMDRTGGACPMTPVQDRCVLQTMVRRDTIKAGFSANLTIQLGISRDRSETTTTSLAAGAAGGAGQTTLKGQFTNLVKEVPYLSSGGGVG